MQEIREAVGGAFAVTISEDIAKVYIYIFHSLSYVFSLLYFVMPILMDLLHSTFLFLPSYCFQGWNKPNEFINHITAHPQAK